MRYLKIKYKNVSMEIKRYQKTNTRMSAWKSRWNRKPSAHNAALSLWPRHITLLYFINIEESII